jgi:hypothetical protein
VAILTPKKNNIPTKTIGIGENNTLIDRVPRSQIQSILTHLIRANIAPFEFTTKQLAKNPNKMK